MLAKKKKKKKIVIQNCSEKWQLWEYIKAFGMVFFKDVRCGCSVDKQPPRLIKVSSHTGDFKSLSIWESFKEATTLLNRFIKRIFLIGSGFIFNNLRFNNFLSFYDSEVHFSWTFLNPTPLQKFSLNFPRFLLWLFMYGIWKWDIPFDTFVKLISSARTLTNI